jgi:2'-5' RNA ligase
MIKKYIEFMNEGKKEKLGSLYRYGCVMIELNISNWDELTSIIDPKDVYMPEDPAKGIESNPHVTLIFGLEKVSGDQIKKVFDNFHEEIHVEIDGVGIFENPEFDVVKLNVIPDGALQHLHDELKKLPNEDKFDVYEPHITLAYVKKGTGKKYANPDYKYTVKNIGSIKYSTPSGNKIYFDYDVN